MKVSVTRLAAVMVIMMGTAHAVVIDFAGGTATQVPPFGGSLPTSDTEGVSSVDYYTENGYKVDFIGNGFLDWTSSFVGKYDDYDGDGPAVNNAVLHGHWLRVVWVHLPRSK